MKVKVILQMVLSSRYNDMRVSPMGNCLPTCRERGARALEERLAVEKMLGAQNAEDPSHRDAADSV